MCLLSVAFIACPANGQTVLKAVYGWGDAVRLGRWTCLFVTVSDPQTRSAEIQIHGTYGTGAAMLIRQTVVVEPRPRIYALLFPLNADPSHIAVTLKDSATEKTIASQLLQDPGKFTPAGHIPVQLLGAGDTLIGISGDVGDALLLQSQFKSASLVSGTLNQSKLPDNAIGYEGISLLVLASADLSEMDGGQQRAIVDWINAGGNLLFIPGADPLPENSPLLEILPCDIGVNKSVALPKNFAATQPSEFNGRQLQPRAGAQPIRLADDDSWIGYSNRVGLGVVTVLPANVAALKFTEDANAVDFWRATFSGMVNVKGPRAISAVEISDEMEEVMPVGPRMADSIGRGQRETASIRHLLVAINAANSHEPFPWTAAIPYLFGIFLIIGPLDWVMLLALGMDWRNWLTVIGWLGLLTCCGVYWADHPSQTIRKIHDVHLIDQVDDHVIAATDLTAVESNRSEDFIPQFDAGEWYEPANQWAANFDLNRFLDFDFREDRKGCHAESLALCAGEPQSLRGESISNAAAILAASSLMIHTDSVGHLTLTGNINNQSALPFSDIQIITAVGSCHISLPLASGASRQISEALTAQPLAFDPMPADAFEIVPARTDRIAGMVKSGSFACIYAQLVDSAGSGQWTVCRAVAPVSR